MYIYIYINIYIYIFIFIYFSAGLLQTIKTADFPQEHQDTCRVHPQVRQVGAERNAKLIVEPRLGRRFQVGFNSSRVVKRTKKMSAFFSSSFFWFWDGCLVFLPEVVAPSYVGGLFHEDDSDHFHPIGIMIRSCSRGSRSGMLR